ncbi:MAG TPA: prephenate dehydrogenase/arogenate dehydrogenase family protein [Candidatus Binatia bacterium]|nr:prephenate dehydrogenase/arogenate dehydrogenase family protein [Candidatus Binatia bacterium]
MRIALLGLGLIGGSIARALAERSEDGSNADGWHVVAWTPDGRAPATALAVGAIEATAESVGEAVHGADLVVLAAPPLACLDLLEVIASDRSRLHGSALVTDVASTKGAIVERAADLGLPFVGGHPMAGVTERGFGAADGGLFAGHPWVVTTGPSSPEGGEDRVAALARACGAIPVPMSAADHDRIVAGISHLPLVVAAAIVETVVDDDWSAARDLAAGGWASATRLARGDVAMATGIAVTNREALIARLAELEGRLESWRHAIEEADADALAARFEDARRLLEDEPPRAPS